MKKMLIALLLAVVSLSAKAQFDAGTSYVSASLTGLNMSYNSKQKFNLGLDVIGGYFVEDSWMVLARGGYTHQHQYDKFNLGAGARYYIMQNGIYLGAGLNYQYINSPRTLKVHNLFANPEVGYCFYLNQHVSVEPAVYYDISLNHFSDYSTVGLRIGFGYYF